MEAPYSLRKGEQKGQQTIEIGEHMSLAGRDRW